MMDPSQKRQIDALVEIAGRNNAQIKEHNTLNISDMSMQPLNPNFVEGYVRSYVSGNRQDSGGFMPPPQPVPHPPPQPMSQPLPPPMPQSQPQGFAPPDPYCDVSPDMGYRQGYPTYYDPNIINQPVIRPPYDYWGQYGGLSRHNYNNEFQTDIINRLSDITALLRDINNKLSEKTPQLYNVEATGSQEDFLEESSNLANSSSEKSFDELLDDVRKEKPKYGKNENQ